MSTNSEAGPRSLGSFSRRVAVIVGGGSGLGRAVAKGLARQGANIVVADFDGPRMDRTVDEVVRLGTSEAAIALSTDIRSDSSVHSLVRDSIKTMGRVDLVVNAAGVLLQGKLEKISGEDWTWMLETNLVGAVRTSTAYIPHMTARGSGQIVNVVSYGGLAPNDPVALPYDTGHAALAVFSEGLARQLDGTGVGVSIFCPGAKGPRIGQNTRSRGVGRLFSGPDKGPDVSQQLEQLASTLIDGLDPQQFLILGDPSEAKMFEGRWGHVDGRRVSR
ncbi:MAG TPA: SDR family oxidoreductase [Candidatus Nitrosotalea sp.]|nr:SDR family oxidoreductase [Candidatus Nitrosotalea sp.]